MLLLPAILTGLITDTAGAPIANASVEIVNPTGPATKTDEDGQFRFPDLPTNNVHLRIRAVGFATQVRPAAPGTFAFPNLPPGRYALKIQVPLFSVFEINDLEIPRRTETTTTRTIQRQKPSPPNMVCL